MSSRDRSLLAVVVLIIIAAAGYFAVVEPEHHKVSQIQAQIETANTALQTAESQVSEGEAAESQSKRYAAQLKSLGNALPSDQQVPEIINELQAVSTKTHVAFQVVSVSAPSAAATPVPGATGAAAITFPSQAYTLEFTGTYFAIANLLGDAAAYVHADDRHFKATGRLLSISTVSLTGSGDGTVTANVSALDYDLPSTATSVNDLTG